MNKLDSYIIKNYIKSFFLGMMMFFLIFLLAESIKLTGWIMDGKMTFSEGIKYLRYGLPEITINTAPLGVLLGSLLSISKMARQLEITAMKTGGISFFRVSLFPLIFSFFISLIVLNINYNIYGKYNLKKSELKAKKIEEVIPVKTEKEFILVKINKNQILYSGYGNKNDKFLKDVQIIEVDDNFEKIVTIYTATTAKIKQKTNDIWEFENLKKYDVNTSTTTTENLNNFTIKMSIDEILADPVVSKHLTMKELREKIVYFSRVGADTLSLKIDYYYRIAFSFSAFIMAFIGLSLGSRYVRGGAAVNIGLSVIIGYSYYGVSTILKSFANLGSIPVYLACFIPLIIYFSIGIYLFKSAEY